MTVDELPEVERLRIIAAGAPAGWREPLIGDLQWIQTQTAKCELYALATGRKWVHPPADTMFDPWKLAQWEVEQNRKDHERIAALRARSAGKG